MGVSWDPAAFRRAKVVGREGALLELRVEREPQAGAAFGAFVNAVNVANDVLAAEEAAGRELYGLVRAVAPGPRGPVADFSVCEPVEAMRLYLDTLVSDLEAAGIAGLLEPISARDDLWWFDNNTFDCLTAMMQLHVDVAAVLATWDSWAHQPANGWHVDEHTTKAALDPVLDWTIAAGERVQVWQGMTSMVSTRVEAPRLVYEALGSGMTARVQAWDGPARMRSLSADQLGDVIVHSYEPRRRRIDHLDELASLLGEVSAALRGGWIQEADTAAMQRRDLLTRIPPAHPLMERVGNALWLLFHLEVDHVVDAFVAQLLTDRQLGRAHDLDHRWQLREVAPGRHLVVARDPGPWLDDHPLPLPQRPEYDDHWRHSPIDAVDQATLSEARAEFGELIMTLETLVASPFVDPASGAIFPAPDTWK